MPTDPVAPTARYVVLDVGRAFGRIAISRRIVFATAFLLFPVAIAIACKLDGTWHMTPPAKGLAQHPGFWVIFVTTPSLLLLTSHLIESFTRIIRQYDTYCSGLTSETRAHLERLVSTHVDSLALRSESRWVLTFIVLVMFFWSLVNIVNTISPIATYGHDVFDSYAHPAGFYITRLYVVAAFTVVYAVALFATFHVTVSLVSILRFVAQQKVLKVNLFHADNCGGTSQFGNVNLMILAIYAHFFAVIYAMYVTHHATYFVMIASLLACSMFAIVQSVLAVYYIHVVVRKTKHDYIEVIATRLTAQLPGSLERDGHFPGDLLSLRDHVAGIRTFPYAKGTAIAVGIIQFIPAVGAVKEMIQKWL